MPEGFYMFALKLFKCFLVGFFLFAANVFSLDHELLKTDDVNKIMKQIFEQHVDKKEMTASILKNSFKVYVDQFDPERIYLLDQDVIPFLQLSDSQVEQILNQYTKKQFNEYSDLNSVIQKAIYRVRQMRAGILRQNPEQLFKSSTNYSSDGYEEWRDPDLKRLFPKNDYELSNRLRHQIIQFIASERKRYGDDYVLNHAPQTLKIFEAEARNHENQYLFLTNNGQPMSEEEKQNAFAMHVLKALANSLDAHTTVLSPAEAYDMRMRLEKEVDGVGIELQATKNGFIVLRLSEGGPALKSGQVQVNDRLVQIDGVSLRGKSLNEVIQMLSGKIGTKVILVLNRNVDENGKLMERSFNVDLEREEVAINADRAESSFEVYGNGIIGKIKLDSFYQSDNGVTSENDVRDAIKKLDKQGNLRGLVLDLRENSGGFLTQAVKVVGLFISNGVVVISKYFNGDEHFYRDMDGKKIYDGPLIVLTSKATASAAEIVAQALQDYGVAIVVGDEHTYGKGSIQSQTVTENQRTAFFKVTVGKYYTVSGKTPQIQGVKANIIVPSQFVHENIGEEYLDNPLKQDVIPSAYEDSLADVPENLKPWYLHYYIPMLQQKKVMWESLLPTLKMNSEYRIAHNKNYQLFLNGTNQAQIAAASSQGDLPMAEAVNILKDMVGLQSTYRHQEALQTAEK